MGGAAAGTAAGCLVQDRGIEQPHLHQDGPDGQRFRKAWTDLHPADGAVRFDHDHYLKLWALTQPRIDADFPLLDEAQDTHSVVEQIFLSQRDHAQLVMVGDSAQAIYHWRGAKDVMTSYIPSFLPLPTPRTRDNTAWIL